MKKIVVGIMICTVSASFAQSDEQIRASKSSLRVQARPAAVVDQSEVSASSRTAVKSSEVTGVIRIKNGTPFIDLSTSSGARRMFAVNLPKRAAVEGQTIRFSYTVDNSAKPANAKCDQVIRIYDVATVKK